MGQAKAELAGVINKSNNYRSPPRKRYPLRLEAVHRGRRAEPLGSASFRPQRSNWRKQGRTTGKRTRTGSNRGTAARRVARERAGERRRKSPPTARCWSGAGVLSDQPSGETARQLVHANARLPGTGEASRKADQIKVCV